MKSSFKSLILLGLAVIGLVSGCTGSGEKPADETGQKTVIGYVNADPIYLISITDKIKSFVDFKQEDETILYKPSARELLTLQFSALKSLIKETALKQPSNKIAPSNIAELAEQISRQRGEEIASRWKSGESLQAISDEFHIPVNDKPLRVIRGNNPGYDEYIWDAQPEVITGPVVSGDRVLIFKVLEKGLDGNQEFADIVVADFLFLRNEAKKQLEKEVLEKSDIKVSEKYFFALKAFFEDDLDTAESTLSLLKHGGVLNEGWSDYLHAQVNIKRSEKVSDSGMNELINGNFLDAIENCSDTKLKPHFRHELGLRYVYTGDREKAIEQLSKALDEVRLDIHLVVSLNEAFKQLDDEKNIARSEEILKTLRDSYEADQAGQAPTRTNPLDEEIQSEDDSDE